MLTRRRLRRRVSALVMLAICSGGPMRAAAGDRTDEGTNAAEASWLRRSTAHAVIFATNFPDADSVLSHIHGGATPFNTWDQTIKASGAGSYRVEIAPVTGPNATKSWTVAWASRLQDMLPDATRVREGESTGQSVFVQWRQRFDAPRLAQRYSLTRGWSGWKQVIIGQGDVPGEPPANSCTHLELVVHNYKQYGLPGMYHSCGMYAGFGEPDRRARFYPDEWMTFQVEVSPGPWRRSAPFHQGRKTVAAFYPSTVRLWVAREGRPSVLALERKDLALRFRDGHDRPRDASHVATYGRIWLLAHHTGKDETEEHPRAFTWYDELIISRERIPEP